MRKPLSNKRRFEIFRRDGFTCQYCGATAPDAKLRVDHIQPVAKGGECVEGNFITVCHDCNSGKAADDVLPVSISYEEMYPKKPRVPRPDKRRETISRLVTHLEYCLGWMCGGPVGKEYYDAIKDLKQITKKDYRYLDPNDYGWRYE